MLSARLARNKYENKRKIYKPQKPHGYSFVRLFLWRHILEYFVLGYTRRNTFWRNTFGKLSEKPEFRMAALYSCQLYPLTTTTTTMLKRPHHEKLPKELAPERGGIYVLAPLDQNSTVTYEAEIVKYGGGCWATVRVTNPLESTRYYKAGDTFDVRVAMYEFSRVASETTSEAAP
jgi:hypothetical protein